MRYNQLVIVLCLFISSIMTGNAQNLVPNPGFELLKKEPPCSFTIPGKTLSDWLFDWQMPTGGTTDVWYADSTTDQKNCRQNTLLTGVKPHQGGYCIGLYTSGANAHSLGPVLSREYAQVKLIKNLQPGKVYYAEMYVLLADQAALASNNIGFYFSVEPVQRQETPTVYGGLLDYTPQVNETKIITNRKQWVKVSGCFVAQQAYQYLTIGNFFNDEQTSFSVLADDNLRIGSYYLVDDITVREANIDYLPSANFLGADTTLCPNQSLTITLPNEPAVSYAGPEIVSNQILIDQSGIYSITATVGQCIVMDTLQVVVEAPVILPPDTTLCRGDVLTLVPQPAQRQYTWSDGSADSVLSVREEGLYWARVISSYCALTDTIRVKFLDCPGEVPNVITPNGDGKNDRFIIKNIQLLPWRLEISNRWGRMVYDVEPYQNDWRGDGLPGGLYYFLLSNQQLKRRIKGWVQIIR